MRASLRSCARTGATFMKLGRAPTTWRNFISPVRWPRRATPAKFCPLEDIPAFSTPRKAQRSRIRRRREDDALLVVDKPAGLALHPTARYHVSTLTRALETRHRNAAGEKPDPAHRLDRETSGLVACGRGSLHTRALKAAFAARQVDKAYLALCEGEPRTDEFQVDVPLSVGTERIKVKVRRDPNGMPAVTAFRVLSRYRDGGGKP